MVRVPPYIPKANDNSGIAAAAGFPSVVALAVDRAEPGSDKTVHTLHVVGRENAKLIAVLPGEEPCSMTTWQDRIIIAQGNRLYELKRDEQCEYALIELTIDPNAYAGEKL